MIINFKIFESKKDVKLQNKFANTICDLYNQEHFIVQNNFSDYSEEEPSYYFSIRNFHNSDGIYEIECFKDETTMTFIKHLTQDEEIENFIKSVLIQFDEVLDLRKDSWAFYKIKIEDLPEIIKSLSIDKFELWRDVKNYNL